MVIELTGGKLNVVGALHQLHSASRVQLSQYTGLSPQSLSRIMQELMDLDLVVEVARRRHGPGQPAIEMTLKPGKLFSVGLVIESDRIAGVLSCISGLEVAKIEQFGAFHKAEHVVEILPTLVQRLLAFLPDNAFLMGIGISQSGFFFQQEASRLISRADIQGWLKVDLAHAVHQQLGVPVILENDGRTAAAGHLVGAIGRQFANFFVVLLTRGVGGGCVANGRLLRGRWGNAGELAVLMPADVKEIRPTTESLEAWLTKYWSAPIDQSHIEAAVKDKDQALMTWLATAATVLNSALKSVVALLDPEVVVISGMLPLPIRKELAKRVRLDGPKIGSVSAPVAQVVVDPRSDCLKVGALALPIAHFLTHGALFSYREHQAISDPC